MRAKQATDYFLLIGPPGTGKTSNGIAISRKRTRREKHFVAFYTNRAVDEICGMLADTTSLFLDFRKNIRAIPALLIICLTTLLKQIPTLEHNPTNYRVIAHHRQPQRQVLQSIRYL